MRVAVAGVGAVGSRVIRRLVAAEIDVVVDADHVPRGPMASEAMHASVEVVRNLLTEGAGLQRAHIDAIVIASPAGTQVGIVRRALGQVGLVVTTSDSVDDVRNLLAIDSAARAASTAVVVGAGFSPGLSCLLAVKMAAGLDEVTEIHVAKLGTGGPACARQHHYALGRPGLDWRDGQWHEGPGGSGRELCWFPPPVGAADCYRAALPDPLLALHRFPDLARASAKMAATRRDRLTARLPMLTPPHVEGTIGAIRVEVRGRRGHAAVAEVMGVAERPAVAVAAVAGAVVVASDATPVAAGAHALASLPMPDLIDHVMATGIRVHRFTGTEGATGW